MLIKRSGGKFFCVYDTDALIFNFLFGYMLLPNLKCGFPDNALNKVINKLEELSISYKIEGYQEKFLKEKDFENLNDYIKLSIVAKKTADLNTRLDLLIKNIKLADRKTIEHVIEYIEQCLRL